MGSPDAPDGKPPYTALRAGRWYWQPSARLRRSHGLKVVPLGADQVAAWAYARTLNRDLAGLDPGAARPGTVAWLFAQFFASDRFTKLAASTQGDYRWLAKRLGALEVGPRPFGQYDARVVRARHADKIYEQLTEGSGHATAHYACRFARRVWKWGGRREFVDQHPNPWSGMELAGIAERHQVWDAAMIPLVVEKAAELGRPSIGLAVLIAYCFGHRQGDVLGLMWSALDARDRKTGKTGARVPIVASAYPDLEAALETERQRQAALTVQPLHVLVCEMTGLAWQADTFRHEFRRIATAAGIPKDLQFRDLRATAATELKDAGADVIDMSTHTGHRTLQMARRYARPTEDQFKRAAAKRIAARKGTR